MSAPILTVIEKVIFLQNVDVFADVPSEHLAYLASIATVEEYEAGEEVFREGDAADAMYLVLSGGVRMHRLHEFVAGCLYFLSYHQFADHLGHMCPDQMTTQELSVLGIKDQFDKPVFFSGCTGFA